MVSFAMSLHRNRGAKRAREARSDLGLDPDGPLECILSAVEQRAGLPVCIWEMPEHVAGACWSGQGTHVLHVNGAHAAVRQRFTLAHELGHVRCGHDGHLATDTLSTLSGATADPREIEANAFAAEFLMPCATIEAVPLAGPVTLEDVVRLASFYGVSASAMAFRLAGAGRVDATRGKVLQEEIAEGLHLPLYDHLDLSPLDDRIQDLAGRRQVTQPG